MPGEQSNPEQNDSTSAPTYARQVLDHKMCLVDTSLFVYTVSVLQEEPKPTNQSKLTLLPQLQGASEQPKPHHVSVSPTLVH